MDYLDETEDIEALLNKYGIEDLNISKKELRMARKAFLKETAKEEEEEIVELELLD